MTIAFLIRVSSAAAAVALASGHAAAQVVQDGSFEAGTPNPSWTEVSTNFGTPLCNSMCVDPPAQVARTGEWMAWFGGIASMMEHGSLTQSVTIPAGTATLNFYLVAFSQRTDGMDFFRVTIDGTEVFRVNDQEIAPYTTDYTLVSVDVSAFAGGMHSLVLESTTQGGGFLTNFFVDDVEIVAGGPSTCFADCNADHQLNVNDFVCFQSAFASQSPSADCNHDSQLNVNDFVCFQTAFAAGCSAL